MNKFEVNQEKCVGCGLCEKRCYAKIISVNGKASYKNDFSKCMDCFHCISVCPNNAVNYISNGLKKVKVFKIKDDYNPILSRRSCRYFKKEPIDKELLTEIINGANMAPRFDITFQEREFIVINDKKKLQDIRELVLKQIKKLAKLFSIFKKNPFISKTKRDSYKTIHEFFKLTIEVNKKDDKLLHGAPTLILVAGPKNNVASIDNSHYALGQLLILAEDHNLGACINGYISFFSKIIEKYLYIPKHNKIYAAAILGYPENNFTSYVKRNDSVIEWY